MQLASIRAGLTRKGMGMNMEIKIGNQIMLESILPIGAVSLFCLGLWLGSYLNMARSEHAGYKKLLQETQKTKKEKEESYVLTEEEKLFLESHLYGQWKFSERIVEIGEDNNFQYGAKPNISDIGVEELKESARIMYEDTYVGFTVKIGQNSFTYAQDMYLFANHGGFSWSRNPVYRFDVVEEDTITLRDVYNMDGYKISAEGMKDFIHVKYFTKPDRNDSGVQGNIFTYFGSDIYIDPDDYNAIYVDFCGLWKMERDDNYYGTNGKSEY